MKVALCLSGQPRFTEVCFPKLKENFLDHHDCDVFLHGWFTPGVEYDHAQWASEYSPEDDLCGCLMDLYQPTAHLIEPPKNDMFKEQSGHIVKNTGAEPYIQKSMYYSIREANRLKREHEEEEGFRYDAVVRMRYDSALFSRLIIDPPESLKMYYTDVIRNKEVPCDWCFYAATETMDSICAVYDRLDEYAAQGVLFCGEELLRHHLIQLGIQWTPLEVSNLLARDEQFENRNFGFVYDEET